MCNFVFLRLEECHYMILYANLWLQKHELFLGTLGLTLKLTCADLSSQLASITPLIHVCIRLPHLIVSKTTW
jgi:hypothetical protein